MKNFFHFYIIVFIVLLTSCSDGIQTEQKINALIEQHEITTLMVQIDQGNGKALKSEYPANSIEIENQFLKSGDDYLNLGQVKSIKVKGDQLEIFM